jgi:ABC-type amino acid transport substrate-binding protein
LAIEQALIIHYPFPQYFYVSRSTPRLAGRIHAGLDEMVRDGTFDRIVDKHFGAALADLNLEKRTVIELENPFLPPWAHD